MINRRGPLFLLSVASIAAVLCAGGAYAAPGDLDGEDDSPSVRLAYPNLTSRARGPQRATATQRKSRTRGWQASTGTPDESRTRGFQASTDTADVYSHYEASNFDRAQKEIDEIIAGFRKDAQASKLDLATALDFRGVIQQGQGKLLDAAKSHKEALELLKDPAPAGWKQARLTARNNLAVALFFVEDYDASEKLLTEILDDPDIKGIARTRAQTNRGMIYAETGRTGPALADFSNAVAEARNEQSPAMRRLLAQVLNNQARVQTLQGNRAAAQLNLAEALELARGVGDLALQANVLDSWAEKLVADGAFQAALEKLAAASAAAERVRLPFVRTTILMNSGRALAGLGKTEEALKAYEEASSLANEHNLYAIRREILASRGQLYAKLGQLDPAIDDYKAAIDLAEETRQSLLGESRNKFVQAKKALYAELVSLLLKRRGAEDAEQAFSYLERSQSATLQEQFTKEEPALRDQVALRDIQGTRGVLRQEAALSQQLQARLAAPGANADEIAKLRQQLDAVRRKAASAVSELYTRYNGRYSLYVRAAIDPKTFADIHKRLPPKGMLVTFSLAEDGLYFFLMSQDGKVEFRQNANVSKAALEKEIKEYRELLTTRSYGADSDELRVDSWSDPKWKRLRDATTSLYRKVLEPIADRIQSANQLILAPTGSLYYLPFHALGPFDSGKGQFRFLAFEKKVSYLTSGSLFKALDPDSPRIRAGATPRILALGDVQFDPSLKPLPYSKEEVASIKSIFGGSAVLLEGPKATKRNLLRALNGADGSRASPGSKARREGGFQFVHLATHGILDKKDPNASHLAFEGANTLGTAEIAGLALRGVSLVTLSACNTALADEDPGADLTSLGENVSVAGAAAVVVTLWPVDDLQTANLMKQFYTRLKREGADRLAALQHAQAALAERPESRHPYYWAPFMLYGRGW